MSTHEIFITEISIEIDEKTEQVKALEAELKQKRDVMLLIGDGINGIVDPFNSSLEESTIAYLDYPLSSLEKDFLNATVQLAELKWAIKSLERSKAEHTWFKALLDKHKKSN